MKLDHWAFFPHLVPNICPIPNRTLSCTSSPMPSFLARAQARQPHGHLLRTQNTFNNALRTRPILVLVAAFLAHGFCYAQARHGRNTAHTTRDAVNGAYPGIGGAGEAYVDQKAAFGSSSCIGSFREARWTTPRPDTPSTISHQVLGYSGYSDTSK